MSRKIDWKVPFAGASPGAKYSVPLLTPRPRNRVPLVVVPSRL